MGKLCDNPRVVLLGGGNFSRKFDGEMAIKASGSRLTEMTEDNLAWVSRGALRELLERRFDRYSPSVREERYKEALLASRGRDCPRPSVETPVHELLDTYVLHTHPTILTALSCVLEADRFLEDVVIVDYCDPGITLAQHVKKAMEGYGAMPAAVMQRNHGFFFTGKSLDEVIARHNETINKAVALLAEGLKRMAWDEPYGSYSYDDFEITESDIRAIMEGFYQALFGKEPNRPSYRGRMLEQGYRVSRLRTKKMGSEEYGGGTICFDTSAEARLYARSRRAGYLGERFTRVAPDNIVSGGMNTANIELFSGEDVKEIAAQVSGQTSIEDGVFPRTYVVGGYGILTAGGHNPNDLNPDAAAENAMLLARDSLLVDLYARALGSPAGPDYRLTDEQALFIGTWEVEKARAATMTKR